MVSTHKHYYRVLNTEVAGTRMDVKQRTVVFPQFLRKPTPADSFKRYTTKNFLKVDATHNLG